MAPVSLNQIRWAIACLLLIVTGRCGSANEGLPVDVPFSTHLHRCLKRSDGLPSSWINAILQAKDNYVWIGTDNGLVRYDGTRFTKFVTSNSPQLADNEIRALYEDRDGSIWIGTTRGLTRYRSGKPATLE
jgi:ligand-binding sensor domain-containing protein